MINRSLVIFLISLSLNNFTSVCQGADTNGEDFGNFIAKFSTDKEFQLSRVVFPLACKYIEDPDVTYYTKDNWHHLNMVGESKHTKRTVIEEGPTHIIINYKGIDNGQNAHFYFELKDNKWYLWKMKDEGM